MQPPGNQQTLLYHAHLEQMLVVAQVSCSLPEIIALLICLKNTQVRENGHSTHRNDFLTSKGIDTSSDKLNLQVRETEVLGVA